MKMISIPVLIEWNVSSRPALSRIRPLDPMESIIQPETMLAPKVTR